MTNLFFKQISLKKHFRFFQNTDRGKAETSEATSQTSVKLDTTSTKADVFDQIIDKFRSEKIKENSKKDKK